MVALFALDAPLTRTHPLSAHDYREEVKKRLWPLPLPTLVSESGAFCVIKCLIRIVSHPDTLGRKFEYFANTGVTLTPEHAKEFKELQQAAAHMRSGASSSGGSLHDVPVSSYGAGYIPPPPHSSTTRAVSPDEYDRLADSVRTDVYQKMAAEVQPILDYHTAKLAHTEQELQNVRHAQAALKNTAWYKNRAMAFGAAGLAGVVVTDTAYQAMNNHRVKKINQQISEQDAEIAALKASAASSANAHKAPTVPSSGQANLPAGGSQAPSTESQSTAATAPPPTKA